MTLISMNYNDVDFSRWIVVLQGFTTFGGANFDVTTKDVGFNGSYFLKNRFKEKIIKVPIYIEYPKLIDYDAFQQALYVTEPKKLIFSHQPYRYYYAIPTGDLDFNEFRMNGKGVLTFIIPDGLAHSTEYKEFTEYTEEDGKLIFTVINNGNVEALPVITAKINSENGYFGLVNKTGVMEIGDRELIDSETLAYSERPFDYSDTGTKIADGFAKGTKNVAILNDSSQTLDKNLGIVNDWNRNHLALLGSIEPNENHAGTLTFDLPTEGSLYDYIWWRQIFWALNVNQYGFIKISVSDTDGKFLFGVETIKRKAGVETEFNVLVADGKGGYKFTDFRKKFNCTHKDNENPFNQERGWSDIKRIDDKLDIFWFGSRYQRIIPELKGKKSAKLHVAIGSMAGKPLIGKLYIDGIKYRKDNVADGYNIPNPYGPGSEIVINGENKTFLVDNVPKLNHIIDYSNWLKIPPGKSTIEISTSSWNTEKPDFKLAFEERWL